MEDGIRKIAFFVLLMIVMMAVSLVFETGASGLASILVSW